MNTNILSRKKGQAQEQFPGGIAAVIFIIVVFGIIITLLAYFPGISDWFKGFFGFNKATTEEYYIARQSTEALQCAINSVALGKEWNSCWGTFKPSGGGTIGFAVAKGTTLEDGKVNNGVDIECFFPKDDIGISDAIIEYEEDGWSDNICYAFRGGKWQWRKAPCENSDFKDMDELLAATASKSKLSENDLDEVHNDIAKKIINEISSYEKGLQVFADILNAKMASISGVKTSDDRIRIHYVSEKSKKKYGEKGKWFGDGKDFVGVDLRPSPAESFVSADTPYFNLAMYMDPSSSENKRSCTITNFYLPQEVSGAEKWIAGYGDPNFLIYWQSFPPGEDAAWTSYATWMENVGTVVLFALPVGKIIKEGKYLIRGAEKTVVSGTKTALTSAGSSLISKLTGKTAAKKVQLMLFDISVSRAARIAAIAKAAGQGIFKELIWGTEKHYGIGLKPLLAIAGVTTVASWVGAYFDSTNDKYEKKNESLVLDIPYKEPETLTLNALTTLPGSSVLGYHTPIGLIQPVVLDREGLFEKPSTFYIASPCHTDLVIEFGDVYCGNYVYNSKSKTVVCDVTDKKSVMCLGEGGCKYLGGAWQGKKREERDIPKCGEVGVRKEALDNNLLFKDNNNDLFYDEAIVSYLSGVDILKIIDSDYNGEFDKYEIIDDGMTIVSGGRYGGEIDFESDGTFDAKFGTDDKGGSTVLYVWKNGEKEPFCTFTREGATGYEISGIFYPSSDRKTIEQLQFPKINMEKKTCILYQPITVSSSEPITIKASSGLNFDTFYSPSFVLMDMNHDGYWDYYDGDLDNVPDFIVDGEFGSVMTQWCKIEGIKVSIKNKDSYKDDRNFCYSKPKTGTRIAIFVGVIIIDVVMETFSAGFLTQVAVGFTGGILYVASQQYEKWPGPPSS